MIAAKRLLLCAVCLWPALAGAALDQAATEEICREFTRVFSTEQAGTARARVAVHWDDPLANATPQPDSPPGRWLITVSGGLARSSYMSRDVLSLILCHELGHIAGGDPKKTASPFSVEGQADYYATAVCLKRLWATHDNQIRPAAPNDPLPPKAVIGSCKLAGASENARDLCVRANRASIVLAQAVFDRDERAYAEFRGLPTRVSFLTPSSFVRSGESLEDHPSAQCRLDTLLAGTLGADRPRCWFVPGR